MSDDVAPTVPARGERGSQACSDAGSVPFLQDELMSLRQEAEAASARAAHPSVTSATVPRHDS